MHCVRNGCVLPRRVVLASSLFSPVRAAPHQLRRRVSVMADKKSVLVPIGNGSEEMEAVISECRSLGDLRCHRPLTHPHTFKPGHCS